MKQQDRGTAKSKPNTHTEKTGVLWRCSQFQNRKALQG